MIAKPTDFTATHHALSFAWISKAVIERVGEERGEAIIRLGVRKYGEQRGRRMALRAQADGQALNMANYMAYGEWTVEPGESEQESVREGPDIKKWIYRCPWHKAWEEGNLTGFGRLYCLEIDEALVRGFHPQLRLEVSRTLTNDGGPCEFVFRDVGETTSKGGAIMPWDYHTGHLFKTLGEVINAELGQVGQEAVNVALREFAEHYGEEAAGKVLAYQDTDFNRLPE